MGKKKTKENIVTENPIVADGERYYGGKPALKVVTPCSVTIGTKALNQNPYALLGSPSPPSRSLVAVGTQHTRGQKANVALVIFSPPLPPSNFHDMRRPV
eukprot:7840262-Pyramimonas_sp.AAC.1